MAAPSGTENPPVTAPPSTVPERYAVLEGVVREDPWSFQFFQAVRLLERMQPDREPVGRFQPASREIARFVSSPAMAFPASQIQDIEWVPGSQPIVMINFMGLTGPMGVLPLYYTELIMERVRAKDRALLSFFDLFNHRMVSHFYQAWEKYRFTIAYERGERDRFSHHLLDFLGLGTGGLQDRQAVPDDSLLFYAGLLGLHPRSVTALRQILIDYFDVPVEIDQFVGSWYPLADSDQCCFEFANSFSEQLGVGAVVGDEIWDQQSGLRIRLGPLTLPEYMDFLPQGTAYVPLQALTRFFSGSELDFEVQLVLKREEVPACELNDRIGGGGPAALPQLGWTTWAKTAAMTSDAADTVLRI
jgi:type VI secretion system protein ImpH